MITHTYTRGWSGGGSISKQVQVQSGAEINVDETIPFATSDQLVAFTLDVSQLKGLYIVSNIPLVLETNSSSAAINTITLAANTPFMWVLGDAPLRDTAGTVITTDITALYATNVDPDTAAQLQIRALFDPTV